MKRAAKKDALAHLRWIERAAQKPSSACVAQRVKQAKKWAKQEKRHG